MSPVKRGPSDSVGSVLPFEQRTGQRERAGECLALPVSWVGRNVRECTFREGGNDVEVTRHKTRAIFDRFNIVTETDLRSASAALSEHVSGREPLENRPSLCEGAHGRFERRVCRRSVTTMYGAAAEVRRRCTATTLVGEVNSALLIGAENGL